MITSAMIRMGRIESAVIVAPDTLTVQWLGELYRKFHQVFVHIDEERLDCVRTDYGEAVNPFDVHPLAVVSNELLANEPSLLFELQNIRPDLVVIDEAHRLLHDPVGEHLLALVEQTKHALLLTATPFQLGVDGFMRLVEALELEHNTLDSGVRLIKGVSAVTRHDIPELPIRQPHAHEIEQPGDLGADDPRTQWVLSRLETWKEDGHKALLFVEDAADAQILHETLTRLSHMELFMFHEEMSTKDRDIELSRFKISTSPALISSGAGSEGRNFQFCDVIVHFSLPADPTVLEQRIGRLDRIGREGDIPIHYFKYEGAPFAHTYETLGIFEDASIGASPAMMVLKDYFENPYRDESKLSVVVDDVKTAIKTHEAKWFFPESHDSEMADEVLDQLPEELDALVERFCVDAADCVGLSVVEKDGFSVYFFELGSDVIVETIPGLPIDARYLGTFDREEAVDNQALDFFSNGHELIEGLLVELEDSQRGRMGALKLSRAKVVNTGWKSLTFGHYLVAIRGDHGTFDVNLYALDEDARQISMDEDEVLESLEWSKNASRDDRKDAQRSLRACENLESLDHDDYAALILVKLVK